MITVKKFCCCCDLRIGTEVIAILGTIFSIFTLISKVFENPTDRGFFACEIFLINLQLMTSIVLFMGVKRNNPSYVLFWLIEYMIGIVLLIIGTVFIFYLLISHGKYIFAVAVLNVMILTFLICNYIWICVYSFYIELKLDLNQTQSNV